MTVAAVIIAGMVLLAGLFAGFKAISQSSNYGLQLGKEVNEEYPRMRDNGREFKNDGVLTALAIFPDGDKKKNLRVSQLYVTKKGDSTVLQKEDIRVTEDLAAYPLRLKNLAWPSGEYTLYFKVGQEIEESIDFILK
ncbi:hypothetical protein FRY98_02415 [Paenibacillus faecis]|uniref:Uncharacterized protein n=2 Tax=Paenibacillus TaxID=44249 RepID=A0A5D0CX78_9BACL|nr:hypothetical protein [Paenibacillus faecis]TYA14561.1 hypothetical protein FRY98_02415 [Paenibacillus faecis]